MKAEQKTMTTLQKLLENEKESFLNSLKAQNDMDSLIRTADGFIGRILFRFNEQETSERVKSAAYSILQTVRTSLYLIDSIGETSVYTREEYRKETDQKHVNTRMLVFLAAGGACCAAALILLLFTSRAVLAVVNLPVFLILLGAGMILLFLAGASVNRAGKKNKATIETVTKADPDKVYRHILSLMVTADHLLDDIRSEELVETRHALQKDKDGVNQRELNLLAQILEDAYSDLSSDFAKETVSHIRYYLHSRKIDTVDYSREDAGWFDILPGEGGTLRPALVIDGTLLKKGLASGGER